jgi:nicotinate phosphoribosyltransferase
VPEGSVVFPREPLLRLEGPILVLQLLETTLLCLVNFASLVATNAARCRQTVGSECELLECGLSTAQGPDGGLTASKYCYIGGFDATSNVLAGKVYGIPVRGLSSETFVNAFMGKDREIIVNFWKRDSRIKGTISTEYVTLQEFGST